MIGTAVGAVATAIVIGALLLVLKEPRTPEAFPERVENQAVALSQGVAETSVAIVAAAQDKGQTPDQEQEQVELPRQGQPIAPREQSEPTNEVKDNAKRLGGNEISPAQEKPDAVEGVRESGEVVENSLRYLWKVGQRFHYGFELVADLDEVKQTVKGDLSYSVTGVAGKPTEEELTATGTGFVVSQNGYLVTCAHVVQGSAQINVHLGERQWKAKVIALDSIQDLAILKIEANDLAPLLLSDASDVELAESIRVVGFPLSSMLGKGIKITSGTIAGRSEEGEGGTRSFQVDATVNPGNSGGPIINAKGQVVGVASALLSGTQISDVGFGVPAQEVRKLLKQIQYTPAEGSVTEPKTGPELARMVTPSVAYLEVVIDPALRQSFKVSFDYNFRSVKSKKRRSSSIAGREVFVFPTGHSMPTMGRGQFLINPLGRISNYQGEGNLPYDLDPIGSLIAESLGHEGRRSWSKKNRTEINMRSGNLGFPIPRHVISPHFKSILEPEITTYPAVESTDYRWQGETAEGLVLTKEYEFKTVDEKETPLLVQQGTGTITFDKQRGIPKRMEYSATVKVRQEDGTVVSIPYTLNYTLRDSKPLKSKEAIAQAARSMGLSALKDLGKAHGNNPEVAEALKLIEQSRDNPQRVEELIVFFQSLGNDKQGRGSKLPELNKDLSKKAERIRRQGHSAAKELKELAELNVVEKRQQQVGSIFLRYASRGETFEQKAAVEGLVQWATTKQVPGLIHLLTDEVEGIDWPEHRYIIQALSRFKSKKVYRAIASRLPYFTEEKEAKKALVGFGSDAELVVCEVLDLESDDAREAAVEVLQEIGTSKSLAALNKAMQEEPDTFIKQDIRKAIKAIQKR